MRNFFRINILISVAFITACAAPVMQIRHINKIHAQHQYLGTLSIATFIDERPAIEHIPLSNLYVTPIKPVVYTGNAQPSLPEYLRKVIETEATQTGIFSLTDRGEYQLTGRILSLKAGIMAGPYQGHFFMQPGDPRPLFQPYDFAVVSIHAVLLHKGKVIFQKNISLKMFREAPASFGQVQSTKYLAIFFDEVITLAVKQLLQDIAIVDAR